MKKLFLIFAISAFFVACNDGTTTTEETTTTEDTMVTPETPAPMGDTTTIDSMNVNPDSAQ